MGKKTICGKMGKAYFHLLMMYFDKIDFTNKTYLLFFPYHVLEVYI